MRQPGAALLRVPYESVDALLVHHLVSRLRAHAHVAAHAILERLDGIELRLGHMEVLVPDPHIGALRDSRRPSVGRTHPGGQPLEERPHEDRSFPDRRREGWVELRLHLFALLDDVLLQTLRVEHAADLVACILVDSEDDDAPVRLIREAGQGVVEARRAPTRGLHLYALGLASAQKGQLDHIIKCLLAHTAPSPFILLASVIYLRCFSYIYEKQRRYMIHPMKTGCT